MIADDNNPGLVEVEDQAWPRPVDGVQSELPNATIITVTPGTEVSDQGYPFDPSPAQALPLTLDAEGSDFAPPFEENPEQFLFTPIEAFPDLVSYPAPSSGTAAPAVTEVNISLQQAAGPNPADFTVMAASESIQTNTVEVDLVVASAVAINGGTAIQVNIVGGASQFGIPLAGRSAQFVDSTGQPSRTITSAQAGYIVVPVAGPGGSLSPPSPGDEVVVAANRFGDEVVTNDVGDTIIVNVSTSALPGLQTGPVVTPGAPPGVTTADDGVVLAFVGSGTDVPTAVNVDVWEQTYGNGLLPVNVFPS